MGMQKKHIRKMCVTAAAVLGLSSLSGCTADSSLSGNSSQMLATDEPLEASETVGFNRTTYEVFVYSFYDSDGDGIGDLNGVSEKLDYIADMGFNQIWLMPICPSDTYHKYDVKDYKDIDPEYGTLEDFDALVSKAHDMGITVITDMVINHSSSANEWFTTAADYLRSLSDEEEPDLSECPYVDYYNFSREKEEGYTALPDSSWYYEARFTDAMPDLNLDSEALRGELEDIASFWLNDHNVDGFRMDATSYYYTGQPDNNIAFMNWYQSMVRSLKEDAYIVGEAWTGQTEYASYYASGFDSYMDFAFSGADGVIAKTLKGSYTADGYVNAQIKEEELYSSYNADYVNAPFYTNHDLARSAGYYAGDDGSLTKMAGAMNLFMSGNAFVYYGEELGMKGAGKDENKRAPMYWTKDADAEGMCTGPADMESFEMKFDSFEEQQEDEWSIYNYYRCAIKIRNAFPAISSGNTVACPEATTDEVCVYKKVTENSDETVWIVMNFSEENQTVDLSEADMEDPSLKGVLLTSEGKAELSGTSLEIPARGIAVLQ